MNHDVHYELEISILINKQLKNANSKQVMNSIGGLGLSLDLTLRELQNRLKEKGHPWEIAKAFDDSCPTSGFFTSIEHLDFTKLEMTLSINNKVKQKCISSQMIVNIINLIEYASTHFTLQPGDIILTGTPSGVGVLHSGDKIKAQLNKIISVETMVI